MCSCATKSKVEFVDRDVNHYVAQVQKDTFVEKTTDSIYVEVIQKGDTIYATKYKEKKIFIDKIVVQKDTCWRDSVRVEFREIEVARKANTFDKVIPLLFLLCVIFMYKKFKR